MEQKLFSVLVLTFNQEHTIKDALNSLLFQDYSPVEVIICDDASTDGTMRECLSWIDKNLGFFERISFVKNDQNVGIVSNYARAISLAKGGYLTRLCGDDILAPGAIAKAVGLFEKSDADVIFGNVWGFSRENDSFRVSDLKPGHHTLPLFSLDAQNQFRILSLICCVPAPGAFFRRIFFDTVRLDEINVHHLDDWAMWLLSTGRDTPLAYHDFDASFFRRHRGEHKNQAFEKICHQDIITIIDEIIFPEIHKLSTPGRAAVFLNRTRHKYLLKSRWFSAKLAGAAFNFLRFLFRSRLSLMSLFLRKRTGKHSIGEALCLPFDLEKPVKDRNAG